MVWVSLGLALLPILGVLSGLGFSVGRTIYPSSSTYNHTLSACQAALNQLQATCIQALEKCRQQQMVNDE